MAASAGHRRKSLPPRGGKDRKGVPSSALCVPIDLLQDCVELRLDFIVGEAQHAVALNAQPPRTLLIIALLFSSAWWQPSTSMTSR